VEKKREKEFPGQSGKKLLLAKTAKCPLEVEKGTKEGHEITEQKPKKTTGAGRKSGVDPGARTHEIRSNAGRKISPPTRIGMGKGKKTCPSRKADASGEKRGGGGSMCAHGK